MGGCHVEIVYKDDLYTIRTFGSRLQRSKRNSSIAGIHSSVGKGGPNAMAKENEKTNFGQQQYNLRVISENIRTILLQREVQMEVWDSCASPYIV